MLMDLYILRNFCRKTVNTRENFWNIYCFVSNQMQDETAKDNHLSTAWISHDLIRNRSFLPRLTFKNQTIEFRIDLEASVNCQNVQQYKFLEQGFSATKNKH